MQAIVRAGQRANHAVIPFDQWRPRFLAGLKRSGIVGVAASEAGVSRQTAYAHRQRDEEFRAEWDCALEDAIDNVLLRRAFDLTDPDTPNYESRTAARVLQFLLRGYRPERFKEYREAQTTTIVKFPGYERQVRAEPDGIPDFGEFSDAELDLAVDNGMIIEESRPPPP